MNSMQVIRHILATLAALITWLFCATVAAQTTQPVERDWSSTAEQFVESIVLQNHETAESLVRSGTRIHLLQSNDATPLARLVVAANESQLISLRHYLGIPQALASDLQQDLGGNEALPEDVRNRFILNGDEAATRANQVAANWVKASIHIEADSPLTVAVLWTPEPVLQSTEEQSYQRRLIFILLRGESNEKPQIADIAFGFPGRSQK